MPRIKSKFVALVIVALVVSFVPVATAAKQQNNWSTTQKIVYVGLTPRDQPNFWTGSGGETTTATSESEMLSYAKGTVDEAITFWRQATRGKMKFGSSKFFIGKPGTAVKHCNSSADRKTAMKIVGLKSIPIGTHLVTVNIYDSCGYAGFGEQGGSSLSLRAFGTTTLIHELGHNFNFYHSSTIYCGKSDYSKFNSTNCSVEEYGDFRDLMGSDEWCPDATLSATQRATIFSTPKAKDIKIGIDVTVDESKMITDNLVFQFNYKGIWYFFEYYIPGEERCIAFKSHLSKPHIQVRMVGPAWAKAKGNAVGPMLILRRDSELPTSVVNVDPDVLPARWLLTGFVEGEKFQLPGAPYVLTVKSTGATSAAFTLTKI